MSRIAAITPAHREILAGVEAGPDGACDIGDVDGGEVDIAEILAPAGPSVCVRR